MAFGTDVRRLADWVAHYPRLLDAADVATIVVEGVNDARCVRELGLGEAVVLNQGKSLVHFADVLAAAGRPVELLLDWDRAGNERQARLRVILIGQIKVQDNIRAFLQKWAQTPFVEEIQGELQGIRQRASGGYI
jgi:5S rRNA maturation endonuclease (ribonuclease M5)